MNHNTIAITDPTFTADLEQSQDYVWLAASWLSQMGHLYSIGISGIVKVLRDIEYEQIHSAASYPVSLSKILFR